MGEPECVTCETRALALSAVAWYFDQRRFRVSPVGDGTYYAHDLQTGRYPLLMKTPSGENWPSAYMAITACQARAEAGEE